MNKPVPIVKSIEITLEQAYTGLKLSPQNRKMGYGRKYKKNRTRDYIR